MEQFDSSVEVSSKVKSLKVFKQVTLAAQMRYYKDKFDIRINTTKQLWIN